MKLTRITQVKKIPDTFDSLEGYLSSFKYPLLEEVRADLCSCFEAVSKAPSNNILSVHKIKAPKLPIYRITVRPLNYGGDGEIYKMKKGDVFVLSTVRPKDCSDLNRYGNPYIVALVTKGGDDDDGLPPDTFFIETSQMIDVAEYEENAQKKNPLFAVYLFSIVTHRRIWKALKTRVAKKDGGPKLVKEVLYTDSSSVRNVYMLQSFISHNSLLCWLRTCYGLLTFYLKD